MAVHLQSSKYDRTFLIIPAHGLIGQRVDGILKTIVFSIHNQAYVIVVGTLAKSHKAFLELPVSFYFFDGQFLLLFGYLSKKFVRYDGGRFEYGIGQIRISFRKIYRAQGFLESRLYALRGLLALRRIIERRFHVVFHQVVDGSGAVLQGLPPYELFI